MTGVELKLMIKMHIGFDDTDSPKRGCTTYIAALLVEKLSSIGASFTDYPNLVRLNPNVPWKTRGNGALCLRIRCRDNLVDKIMETVVDAVEENAELGYEGTDPGVVFLFNNVPQEIRDFAKRTVQGVVKMKEALRLIKKFKAEAVGFKKGRGIIGGLAAIGENLNQDYTYEIIAYRTPENRGTPRKIQALSIKEMNERTSPLTFNNVDPETSRILITPRGPDPILYGIRGENPEVVRQAHEMIRQEELVERWVIFRTNHGTDAHLRKVGSIGEIQPYNPVVVQGAVVKKPQVIQGGHVIFSIRDETGEVDCAAYEPTGTLREISKNLIVGDFVEAFGGVRPASLRHPITVNLEKMRILKLAPKTTFFNPICPRCGRRMKSMGTGKGFRCEKCGFRSSQLEKGAVKGKRELKRGLYVTSSRSQRHLAKPLCRYGREKTGAPKKIIKDWHFP
jgi:tRNA(Ile2)-agmatinylcytidine synthase